jgi:hypothetical protein
VRLEIRAKPKSGKFVEKPLPIDGTYGILPVGTLLGAGVPLPPQAILTDPLDFAVQADYPYLPQIHHLAPILIKISYKSFNV